MDTFDTIPKRLASSFARSREHAHHAAQLVAAAGVTLLPPDPEFHYSGATFDAERGAIVGSPLPMGRRVRLVLEGLRLEVMDGDRVQHLDLVGRIVAEGALFLRVALGKKITFPTWELPSGPIADFGPLAPEADDLRVLAQWYAAADATLRAISLDVGTKGEVRLWPHHFDLAALVTIERNAEHEKSRTVGLGLSPGDATIPLPYLYVTPFPYPKDRPTPPLPVGRWQTSGWYGAVLEAAAIDGQRTVDEFLRAAFDLTRPR